MGTNRVTRAAVAVAFLFTVACGLSSAFAGENLPGLAKQGTLVVGLDDTFAPMGFRDPANNLVGFDIDLANAVGEEMGLEIVFQPIEWSAKEMELAVKNIDCIWNGMSRTPDREANMTLTQDYLDNRMVIMTVPGVTINTLEDLVQYQVGTQAGSSGLDMVKASPIYAKLGDNLHEYSTYDQCLLDMQAGRIQAMVVDEVLGKYKNNGLKNIFGFAAVDFGSDYYVIGFRRDKDNAANEQLVKAVEKALKNIGASGKGKAISEKWFGANMLLPIQ